MAVPERVLEGVLDSLGVILAETPGEAYEVAEMIAATRLPPGDRTAVVTHSGGIAIHLADLSERHGLNLPPPGPDLGARLHPLLDHGVADNPLDMGGIIGGPSRFAQVVETFAGSGEYDMVLAVSTAHPPAHTDERVAALLALDVEVPILHLWMAGDQAAHGLTRLQEAGTAVTEDPRAAIRALAGLGRLTRRRSPSDVEPLTGPIETWGIPLVEAEVVIDALAAADAAERIGYPVAVKLISPEVDHKTEFGGVTLDLGTREAVARAFTEVMEEADKAGLEVVGARVQRYRPGLEVIVGALVDPDLGPVVSVGVGGVLTELIDDVVFAPAPVDKRGAQAMISQLRGHHLLDGFRGAPPADVDALSELVSIVSRGMIGSGLTEVEVNPLIWDGAGWVAVDWLAR
jgi:acyl-CoA synthetase (NDP forming)